MQKSAKGKNTKSAKVGKVKPAVKSKGKKAVRSVARPRKVAAKGVVRKNKRNAAGPTKRIQSAGQKVSIKGLKVGDRLTFNNGKEKHVVTVVNPLLVKGAIEVKSKGIDTWLLPSDFEKGYITRLSGLKPERAPVTVKKLSFELQTIKTFVGMQDKKYTLPVLVNKHKALSNHIKAGHVADHKNVIEEVAQKLSKAKKIAETAEVVTINIDKAFIAKCNAIINGAKVRTEFLSGVNLDVEEHYKELIEKIVKDAFKAPTGTEIIYNEEFHYGVGDRPYASRQFLEKANVKYEGSPNGLWGRISSKPAARKFLKWLLKYDGYLAPDNEDYELNGVNLGIAKFIPSTGDKIVTRPFTEWADILKTVQGNTTNIASKIKRIELASEGPVNFDVKGEKAIDVISDKERLNVYLYDESGKLIAKELKFSKTKVDPIVKDLIAKHISEVRQVNIVINNLHAGLSGTKKEKRNASLSKAESTFLHARSAGLVHVRQKPTSTKKAKRLR